MKNMLLIVVLFIVLQVTPLFSQTFMDYVSEKRGDTLVVKSQIDQAGEANALYFVLHGDSINVPAGRVYMLKAGEVYPLQNNPTSWPDRTTIIVGSNSTPLVNLKNVAQSPPLICGYVGASSTNLAGINAGGSLTIKNCAMTPAAPDGGLNWLFTGSGAANERIEFDNCLFERTRWVEIGTFNAGVSYFLKNCYFVNLVGQACRRNGGVYDGFSAMDTFLVENSTHIMAQGMMYKWRNYTAKRIIVNHNTFVNCSGIMFSDLGTQTNMSYTNNVFVNCNVQPFPAMASIDDGEKDIDLLPTGLVNVYPDSALQANNTPRKILVEGNVAYWDASVSDLAATANSMQINSRTTWKNQNIWMNTRTDSMFKHLGRFSGANYSKLTFGTNYSEMPTFTDSKDLFTTQLTALKTFSLATVDTGSTATMPAWRLVNTSTTNDFVYYDFPIPVNLAYSNAKLLSGATGGFPVGDLNWFPTQKATWNAQRTAEYTKIQTALDNGPRTLSVGVNISSPVEYRLEQNYPNPFNPSTTINFSLPHSTNVSVKVYDVLGHEIATLVNGNLSAGHHDVQFDASHMASGVYFYKLAAGDFIQMKKMMLIK